MNALIDATSSSLLLLSPHVPQLMFLVSAIPDTESALAVEVPNYKTGLPGEIGAYPIWRPRERRFVPAGEVEDRVRDAALLAAKKAAAHTEIISFIGLARARHFEAAPLQAHIYDIKRREAERFVANLHTTNPYLMQYAELSALDPLSAAREIILKSTLADEALLKSEYFRLKYLNLLRRADSAANVSAIVHGFKREFFGES